MVGESLKDRVRSFDHHDQSVVPTIHTLLAELRQGCPVARSEAYDGFYVVSRQDDIVTVAKDGETFSAAVQGLGAVAMVPDAETTRAPLFESDPPVHTGWRNVLQGFFARPAVRAHEQFIREVTDQVIDEVAPRGRCEVVGDIAARIPSVVIAEVMGVPRHRQQELARLARDLVAPASVQDAHRAGAGLVEFLRGEIAERRDREDTGGDVLTAVVHAEVDGRRATDAELLKYAFLMVSAGFLTTVDTISSLMLQLAEDPATRRRVVADRTLVPALIEEIVRHESAVAATGRTVLAETTLGGVDLHPGDRLLLAWGSGTRDERYVDDPATFRLDRQQRGRDLGWGSGVHRCLGMHLARLELGIVFDKVLTAMPEFEVEPGTVPERTYGVLRGVRHLNLRWS
ncbi:Cytochrome P450 [Lentzea xinjiangensis]|uniref:Cytochrome P450 n=1 Tax=Lentzea xinjiangensis TaxID=402600 RepID=A0A1H9PSD9_9PSEU|nr:cytochrome P450 [Lentzea xinjiangensis]SER51028.1 Cytochrome P450 [Lentzea xinjiangensis]